MDQPPRPLSLLALWAILLAGCGGTGASTPAPTGPAAGPPTIKKILILGLDGVRPDALQQSSTPHLDRLRDAGAWSYDVQASAHTWSGPGWSTVLTGTWPEKHGCVDNRFQSTDYQTYPHFFARLQQARPGTFTASLVDWDPLDQKILGATGATVRFLVPADPDGDARVTQKTVDVLSQQDPDVLFCYLTDADSAGHTHGFHPSVPEYRAAIETVDRQVGEIVQAMESRPTFSAEDWLVLVVTDHGGTLDGSHGRDEPAHRTTFLIASGRAARRGRLLGTVNQPDVTATALTHLGVTIDPAWALDGRPTGLASVTTALGQNLLYNGDAEVGRSYTAADTNTSVPGWRDLGPVTLLRYGSAGYPSPSSPGSNQRGQSFFCGGLATIAEMAQTVDVTDLASAIDAGRLRSTLSAFLGGYQEQRDLAGVRARFLTSNGGLLGEAIVAPVTLEDRRAAFGGTGAALTGLLARQTTADVPPGTRAIEVRLRLETHAGDNDGYADDISLVLFER